MGKFADELAPKFADSDEPTLESFTRGSIGWFIQRRIEDAAKPGARRLGYTHLYGLRRMQRAAIASVKAAALKPTDLIAHCQARKAAGVQAATIGQDVSYLRGVIRDYVELEELPQEAFLCFMKVKRRLEKEQLIGKSKARSRRPTPDELERLIAHFHKQNEHPRTTTDMVIVTEFSYHSARRISETCRLRYGDVDVARRTCWVYDLKNPKGKGESAEFPLLGRAWEIVEERMRLIELKRTPEQRKYMRLFPFSSKTCSARYTLAKKALGIVGLRLHDNRREAISRLFEAGYNVPEVAKVSLHKNPTLLLGSTYTALKPEDLHMGIDGPAAKRTWCPNPCS
jgi:integrase